MAARNRRNVVVEYPQPIGTADRPVVDALETLRGTVGMVTSLLIVPLQMSDAGLALVAAGAGTALAESKTTWDLEDARIDQVRIVGFGASSAAGHSVRIMYNAVQLATATLGNAGVARFTGSWTQVTPVKVIAGDQTVQLEVVGNGAATQTLHRVELHARTLNGRT